MGLDQNPKVGHMKGDFIVSVKEWYLFVTWMSGSSLFREEIIEEDDHINEGESCKHIRRK